MEALLTLMERQSSEFKEMKESFKELKRENAKLSNEILGIRVDVKAIKAMFEKNFHEEKEVVKPNDPPQERRGEQDRNAADKGLDDQKEPVETIPAMKVRPDDSDVNNRVVSTTSIRVLEINFKNIQEQRDWMKRKFAESVKHTSVSDGYRLRGTTLQEISQSIFPIVGKYSSSCTIKLSNFLSYALTDARLHEYQVKGPSIVEPHVSEVYTVMGGGKSCVPILSVGISSTLRLTIYPWTDTSGNIDLVMAFTPQDVPTDYDLLKKLCQMPSVPDVWTSNSSRVPLEAFICHGKLLARGHMTPERFSIIHIDVLEVNNSETTFGPIRAKVKLPMDYRSMSTTPTFSFLRDADFGEITCSIEIANCLNSHLKNRTRFFPTAGNNIMPYEIRPFHRGCFYATDTAPLEATFTYEIGSTDLFLVVSLQAYAGHNSFVAAFASLPIQDSRENLAALMDPNGWTTHLYKKCAEAKDGEQVIQIRNIRASVKMTECVKSHLDIQVFVI